MAIRSGSIRWAVIVAALVALVSGLLVARPWSAGSALEPAPVHRDAPTGDRLLSLPVAARGTVSATLGAASVAYWVTPSAGGFRATSRVQALHSTFSRRGVVVRSGRTQVGLSLAGVGYGAALRSLGAVSPTAEANRVTYEHSGLSEWYANGPLGLEQGFTLTRAGTGHGTGPLTLSMALSGDAHASLARGGQTLMLSDAGAPALRYAGLVAVDANGRTLHSWLALQRGRLLLRVDTQDARLPIKVDPLILTEREKLTGGDGDFGDSVALSADGNTALIGSPGEHELAGAVWVFTRSGGVWTEGQRLTEAGTGEDPGEEPAFGSSVALSSNGDMALIGGPSYSRYSGAVWVFTRSGSVWTEQQKLTGSGEIPATDFGQHVALSADENTALIGDSGRASTPLAAVWVFTRSGGVWTEQEKIAGAGDNSENAFGSSLALSSDGDTALIGGGHLGVFKEPGAAWVFTRSGSVWTEQQKITRGGSQANFGVSVALSAEGNTALIGASHENANAGAAWVFTRSGTVWTEQQKLAQVKPPKPRMGSGSAWPCPPKATLL